MTTCTKCKIEKANAEFLNNPKKINGLSSWCRNCYNLARKKYPRKRYRELDLIYQRKVRANGQNNKTEESRRYREKNPEKVKAHWILNRAILKGKIKRSPCEVCGENRPYRVHAHHPDYSKPLEVKFLCPIHHKLAHIETLTK